MSDVMRRIFVPFTVFVLSAVLMAGEVFAVPLEWESLAPFTLALSSERGDAPSIFSTDDDIFLGQKRRRRGGGSRGGGGGVWAYLYYGDTTLKPKDWDKIKPNFYGFQVGLDFNKSRGSYSSLFFNLNKSKTDFGGPTSKIDNYLVGYSKVIYWLQSHLAFSGSIGYDKHEISLVDFTGTGNGLQTNFFGEFGLDFILGQWGIKPFYALQYDFLYHGNIGKAPYVLMPDTNDHGLQQLLGMRLNWKVIPMLELQGRATWVHEMLDKPPPFFRGRFSPMHGVHTPAMTFFHGNTGRDWAWIGIGARLEIINLYFYGDYDVLINERHTTHLGSVGVCFNW